MGDILGDNAIGATGAKLITKMNMPNLTILFLCIEGIYDRWM